jgi:hypothetical protein
MELSPDNPSSWDFILQEIDLFPNDEHWRAYKANVKAVLDRGIADNLHEDFRAGMGMHDVIFSTAPKHGLKRGEHQVAFSFVPSKSEFYVAYATRALVWGDPISLEGRCSIEFDDSPEPPPRFLVL